MLKMCFHCKENKSVTEFYFFRNRYASYCKMCSREKTRQWQKTHTERAKQYQQEYRVVHREHLLNSKKVDYVKNREKRLEQTRLWALSNSEKVKSIKIRWVNLHREKKNASGRLWASKNGDKRLLIARNWRRNNTERLRILWRKYHAQRKGAEGLFNQDTVRRLWWFQNGQCQYCKKLLTNYHIDHRLPISRGGSNKPENLCLSCPSCNSRKNAKTAEEFFVMMEK